MQREFLAVPLKHQNDPEKMKSPDFAALVKLAQQYTTLLNKVKGAGDPASAEIRQTDRKR